MSRKLPRITATDLLRALQRDGWQEKRHRGSHAILYHTTKPGRLVVPVHLRQTLGTGLLNSILRDAGLTVEDFRRLLQ
ncbi:MAG: type II toxin-antitoxin system HicA family toxin [Chloroflexota bacterium]